MRHRLTAVRVVALVALAACGAGLSDAAFAEPTFCRADDACGTVTASDFARPLGVPLPAVGLVGFGLLAGLSLVPTPRTLVLIRALAAGAAVVGGLLVVVQVAVLHQLCPLCLVADGCGLAAGLLAVGRFRPPERGPTAAARAAWGAAAVVAAAGPVVWAWGQAAPPPPEQVTARWVGGRVTVVEVFDFECRHCRQADAVVREFVVGHPDVRLVRLPAPLGSHPNARTAARAYLAAEAQGKGDEMSAALFAADDRTWDECRRQAAGLGLRLDEYDRVARDPATDAGITATVGWVRRTDLGVPHVWVQDRLIAGAITPESLGEAYRAVRAGGPGR